jgi:hypothetical protein
MIISPSRNFVFIHLEKCGGTSVETALQPYLHWSDIIMGSTIYGERYQQNLYDRYSIDEVNKTMLWKHSTAKDIESFVLPENWGDFKKISVVRDPIDLIKSLYFFSHTSVKYHIGRINRQRWKEIIRTQEFPNAWPYTEAFVHGYADSVINSSGIDGFVRYIFKDDFSFIRPQVRRLEALSTSDLGMVKDLSVLNDEWQDILDEVGIEESVPLQRLNASERDSIELSPKSIKIIKKHFAIDYDVLPGYTGVSWKS